MHRIESFWHLFLVKFYSFWMIWSLIEWTKKALGHELDEKRMKNTSYRVTATTLISRLANVTALRRKESWKNANAGMLESWVRTALALGYIANKKNIIEHRGIVSEGRSVVSEGCGAHRENFWIITNLKNQIL